MLRSRSILISLLLLSPALVAGDCHHDSHLQAQNLLKQSLEAHGGIQAIEDAGGLQVSLQGELDLTTRLQGRSPFRPEPTPIKERMTFDTRVSRLAYDIDWYNYHGSNQQLREIISSEGRQLFIDKRNQNGGWLPFATVPDAKLRYQRLIPHFLLQDALQQHRSLKTCDNKKDQSVVIRYDSEAGNSLNIQLDPETHLLRSLTSSIDMPLLGSTTISWHWSDYYQADNGLMLPRQFSARLGEQLLKNTRMQITLGAPNNAFSIPDGMTVGEPPALIPASEFTPYGQREPQVETLAPGVFMVVNLRPGFRLLFVEFNDFVLAVDAPTGWYEMQQIPPMNWSRGDSVAALGEKYLRAIHQTVPDKPVRYLVLTHHHSDHIGGLQPFIDAGATLLAGRAAAHMADIAVSGELTVETVSGKKVIRDDSMEVQLIELPDDNPKADNYLMVYLPHQKTLYATAFIYPVPEAAFPPKESIPLSQYFVEWVDNSGLDIEHIYNVHAQGRVEEWQLEAIRELSD